MSEPKEIPAAMLDAAIKAVCAATSRSEDFNHYAEALPIAEAALEAAGVPEMLAEVEGLRFLVGEQLPLIAKAQAETRRAQARIAELESDTERLRWLMDNSGIDGFYGVTNDRYDFAFDCADEADRDEPNKEDEFNGWRRLIDAAMKSAESVEVSE